MNETAIFSAPWDTRLLVLTLVISAGIFAAALFVAWLGLTRVPILALRLLLFASAAVPIGAWALAALLAPRAFVIGADRLTIRRAIAPIDVPFLSIHSVRPLSKDIVSDSTRTMGSGGLFGYYGSFRNRALGDYRMYATRGNGYVLVLADRVYVLTPERPEAFVEALNRARGAGAGGGT